MKHLLAILIACLPLVADENIIPSTNRVTWQGMVGIEGGIPSITTQFCNVRTSIPGTNIVATGDGVTDDYPALKAALDLCPSNQYIYLPAGTYKINTRLLWNYTHSGKVLKGEDPTTTTINGTLGIFGSESISDTHDVASGGTRGSTNITISGGFAFPPEALRVGWILRLETNGNTNVVNRVGYEGTWPENPQGQLIEVLTETGKTNITFTPPLYYDVGSTAKIKRNYGSSTAPNYAKRVGIENITLHHNNAMESWAIRMEYVDRCWIKNCIVTNSEIAAISIISGYRCNIESNYITTSSMNGSGGGYGYLLEGKSTACLIENNIADLFAAGFLLDDGSSGNVAGYNFSYRTKYYDAGWSIHSLGHHSCHPMFNLWEGNIAVNIFSDFIHGSSSHQTIFRNRLYGWYTNSLTEQNMAVQFHAWNRWGQFVGNVMGWTNRMTVYDMEYPSYSFGTEAIYAWGYNGAGASDSVARTSALRHMNWDTVTSTNHGVVVDASTYPNTNLVSSYYLSAKPEWMGSLSFPMIGPDVNTNDFDNITNPARERYFGRTNYLSGGGQGGGGNGAKSTTRFPRGTAVRPSF